MFLARSWSVVKFLSPLSASLTHFDFAKSFRIRFYVIYPGGHPLPLGMRISLISKNLPRRDSETVHIIAPILGGKTS
jgi:hypothetical protein